MLTPRTTERPCILPKIAFLLWSLLSHAVLALLVFSVLNLVSLVASTTSAPRAAQLVMNGLLTFAALWTVLFHFLKVR